jgi:hypothetical protein
MGANREGKDQELVNQGKKGGELAWSIRDTMRYAGEILLLLFSITVK